MRKLGIALSFAAALSLSLWSWTMPAWAQIGPPNNVLCSQAASFTGTGAAATVIAAAAGKTTFFCGWHITSTSSTTTTFQFSNGSAANCGGGTNFTPAMNVTITAPSVDHNNFAVLSFLSTQNICINAPATVTGVVWFGQY